MADRSVTFVVRRTVEDPGDAGGSGGMDSATAERLARRIDELEREIGAMRGGDGGSSGDDNADRRHDDDIKADDDATTRSIEKAADSAAREAVSEILRGLGDDDDDNNNNNNNDNDTRKRYQQQPAAGRAPVPPTAKKPTGGIYGGTVDEGPKGFQRRKGIRGGVERQRDDRSLSPIQHERFMFKMQRLERQIASNTVSSEAIKNIIQKHMGNLVQGSQVLSNPDGFVSGKVLSLLGGVGPHGAAIVAAISAIVSAPEVVAGMIRTLSQKGLPLNADWRREIESEVNGLMGIEEKKKRLLGMDSYMVTSVSRYQPESGAMSFNSLQNRDEVIISKIGLAEKAVGVV